MRLWSSPTVLLTHTQKSIPTPERNVKAVCFGSSTQQLSHIAAAGSILRIRRFMEPSRETMKMMMSSNLDHQMVDKIGEVW